MGGKVDMGEQSHMQSYTNLDLMLLYVSNE